MSLNCSVRNASEIEDSKVSTFKTCMGNFFLTNALIPLNLTKKILNCNHLESRFYFTLIKSNYASILFSFNQPDQAALAV